MSPSESKARLVQTLLRGAAPVLAEVKYSIPEQYVGRWGRTLQSCADPGNDPLALRVESLRLTFPGNVARVQAVFTDTVLKIPYCWIPAPWKRFRALARSGSRLWSSSCLRTTIHLRPWLWDGS